MAGAFVRHRGLIAFAAGSAMAEAALLCWLAPAAVPLAPQITALPPLAAYHDLRWLFAFNQSWLGFTGVLVLLVVARSAVDAVLVVLAWPRQPAGTVPRPRFPAVVLSCAVLTVLVGLVMSPVVTLMFGVALLPFSWPYLAAVPILLGTAVALSQGGVGHAWWRRLPPVRTAAWVVATFGVLTVTSALMTRLDRFGIVAVAGLAGIADARAWFGLTAAAARQTAARGVPVKGTPRPRGARGTWGREPPGPGNGQEGPGGWSLLGGRPRRQPGLIRQRAAWLPVAPLAAVMVLVLVAGMTRLAFTGAVRFPTGASDVATRVITAGRGDDGAAAGPGGTARSGGTASSGGTAGTGQAGNAGAPAAARPVLVVAGFGSTCCDAADGLRAAEPRRLVRQFSYLGLDPAGRPIRYDVGAGNVSLQVLGDRMATQVRELDRQAGAPVDIVAESEGTLGLYAMLARHPHLPLGSLVLLSPIIEPGQLGQAGGTVPGDALSTLNNLVGGMSPYGSSGARELIDSVSEVGASYFAKVSRDTGLPWLAVVPLADAVTLPACSWPQNVIFVDALHGGLLGSPAVVQLIGTFLSAGSVRPDPQVQRRLRSAARVIAAAAAAWRMPELRVPCSALSRA